MLENSRPKGIPHTIRRYAAEPFVIYDTPLTTLAVITIDGIAVKTALSPRT
jgi:hypothetical protein